MRFRPFHLCALLLLGGLALAGADAGAQTAAPAAAASGQTGFEQACAACHQPDGKGIPGAFPALATSAFLQGPPEIVVKTVLEGRGGMPAFGNDLDDDHIAAILTYARSAWGNSAPAIPRSLVAATRGAPKAGDPSKPLQAH
jgi:mono/diheme cytochrome c family protein